MPPAKPTSSPAKKSAKKQAGRMAEKIKSKTKGVVGDVLPERDPLEPAKTPSWEQKGDALTTATGVRVVDTDNSLKVGPRGSTLLDDFHLREKIMHFDHERIPERVVHARGAAAHGTFTVTSSLEDVTSAAFLCGEGTTTPVFTRFSTVVGSRGSADTARDVRGFATKFYTADGIFDLVGNNIPVFFIQDGIKFPDLIHAAKPEPDREIPQAQTAHDTFWDFASLQPESTHVLMWAMSDRGIPRSYRTMEGFGVHTFRLINAAGESSLVKFHWKPVAGVHSLVWEESQKLGGIDPDFHRRDLWDSIDAGMSAEFEFGVQVMPDNDEQTFRGIDLLDATKIVPEELCPVRPVGRLVLDRNPQDFFSETEQVAFCTANIVPGIDFTDDPLLQARNFSYLDTQLTRLGGPNFNQLPINRTHAPVNSNQRDGFGQQAVHEGKAPYSPNSLGGGCPFTPATVGAPPDGAFVHARRMVSGERIRERPQSFGDHFSQAALFWFSMTPVEQDHIVEAFSFELAKVVAGEVQERMLDNLANVNAELCQRVSAHLGLPAPAGNPPTIDEVGSSPSLSMAPLAPGPVEGRVIGLLANDGVDANGLDALQAAATAGGAKVQVIAPHGGELTGGVPVAKTVLSCESVEFDAVVIADGRGVAELLANPKVATFVQEAYRHHKPVAAWGSQATEALERWGVPAAAPGVVTTKKAKAQFAQDLIEAMGWHRHWNRP